MSLPIQCHYTISMAGLSRPVVTAMVWDGDGQEPHSTSFTLTEQELDGFNGWLTSLMFTERPDWLPPVEGS